MNLLFSALAFVAIAIVTIICLGFAFKHIYKRVRVGSILVVYGFLKNRVSSKNTFIIPFLDKFHYIDSDRKKIIISNYADDINNNAGVVGEYYTSDNLKVAVNVVFFIGMPMKESDILDILFRFKQESLDDLESYFNAKFAETVKNTVRSFTLEDLMSKRKEFSASIFNSLDDNLDGFKLYDVSLQDVRSLPLSAYDEDNHIDILGKRKIIEISSNKKIEISKQLELEKTQTLQAEVENEEARIILRRKNSVAQSEADAEIAIAATKEQLNSKMAQVEAFKNIEIAEINVEKELGLQRDLVHREVEAQKITHQEFLDVRTEESRKKVQVERENTDLEVMQRRKLVEKTEVNENSEIQKQVAILTKTEFSIQSEKEAIENLKVEKDVERYKVDSIGRAEADANAVKITRSNDSAIEVEISKNEISVKQNRADGDFIVEERKANAISVMADAKQKDTSAIGLGEAAVVREKGLAEAEVVRAIGLSQAESESASYNAKKDLSDEVRKHELDIIAINNQYLVNLESVKASRDVAVANASVMAAAMAKSDIKIFGEGDVFQKNKGARFSVQTVDAQFDNSDVLNGLISDYREGYRSFGNDLTEVLKSDNSTGGAIKDVALAANLNRIVDLLGGKDVVQGIINKLG